MRNTPSTTLTRSLTTNVKTLQIFMVKVSLRLLFLSLILLCACNTVSEEDLKGEWLITKIVYKNKDIIPNSHTVKISLLPVEHQSIGEIRFSSTNKSDFPGIETKDLPVKWKIYKDSLIITADSTVVEEQALEDISTLRRQSMLSLDLNLKKLYNLKHDSLLRIRGIKSFETSIKVYTGIFKIRETNDGLQLSSPTTEIELVNKERAFKKAIDGVMP